MNPDTSPKYPRYQDYVIKDGQLVGEFEQMYRDHDDPWKQSQELSSSSEKIVGLHLLRRLNQRFGCTRVVEMGCGLGHYAHAIAENGLDVVGLDVSATAVEQGRSLYPGLELRQGSLEQHDLLERLRPDVIVMAEISWYVLPHLQPLLEFLRDRLPRTKLLHMLSFYPGDQQKYGRDYFTTLADMLDFFDMIYLESGQVMRGDDMIRTWFLGTFIPQDLELWNEGL